MNTSNPFCFAALKIRSIFSTVLFSLTLSPTNGHERPFSLNTSFCGSINTTAVSPLFMSIVALLPKGTLYCHDSLDFHEPLLNELRHSNNWLPFLYV